MKKIIIIILFVFLSITHSITYANSISEAKGKYVIINNQSTNPYEFQNTGTIKSNSSYKSNHQEKTINPYGIDKVIPTDEDNTNLYKQISRYSKYVEKTKKFTTVNFKNNKEETIAADLKYSGNKVNVWVHENNISNAQAILIGKEFDNKIHPLINKNFGEESDVDGNSKINILIYDIKDNFESTNTFIQGYFNAKDLYNTKGSNKGEVIYIDTYPTMELTDSNGNLGLESIYPIIVHEFQHMVSFNENKIKENGKQLETWIDEGLSLAAESMYTQKPRMDRIEYYNISNNIQNGHSLLYWDNNFDTLSNYSLSYLFMEYVNVQAKQGDKIYKEIIKSNNNDYRAIEALVKKYIDDDIDFGEFMTDFRIALTLNQNSGKYGFYGKEGFDKLQKRIYRGSDIDLRGGGAVVVEVNDLLKIPNDKGKDIAYIGSSDIQKGNINHVKIIGKNRYDTAAKISKEAFKNSSDTVILINGKNSSDGLSAAPFASLINASMLLVDEDKIPKETMEEIKRLKPKKIYLIGGENVIEDAITEDLDKNFGIKDDNVIRIGGRDREETSLLISREIAKISEVTNVYVVNGYRGEADAMSILSKACNEKSPILITNGKKLNIDQSDFIKSIEYPNFYFIGGNVVLDESLLDEVKDLLDVEISVLRIYGDSRQDTNAEVLEYFYEDNVKGLIVAKSDNLIDALCVGAFAGKGNIPVVIASDSLSDKQITVIKYKGYDNLIEVGGGININIINRLK